jgi:drug/metabolite transporter (DMT)-like permease
LNGVPGGTLLGNALVLTNAVLQAFQITAMERFAPRYDPRALTFLQMATAFVGFAVGAVALGELELPRGWTVWGALLVTGIFAGALGYLIATWVQARTTAARAALVFTLEAPFAALFGVLLADEVLGWQGWLGCAVMMGGILLAEPAAARALARLVPRGSPV